MTLDPTFKAKWVAALRSGLYKQTKRALKTSNGHCCLGVACEVAGLAQRAVAGDSRRVAFIAPNGDESHMIMPLPFAASVGFSESGDDQRTLANMNDSGESFLYIADYIEANL